MPNRPRPLPFARRLEAADRPLYLVDEERWVIAANAACCQWTGWDVDRLLTLRCSYHSLPAVGEPTDWSAALCPPPEAFDGQMTAGHIAWMDAEGRLRRRKAQFVALSLGGMGRGVLVAVGDEVAAEDATAEGEPDAAATPSELHAALWRWRATLRGRFGVSRLAGTSAAARRVCQQTEAAIQATAASVLIWGPPGCGREQVARCIASAIATAPSAALVVVDGASATPESFRRAVAGLSSHGAGGAALLLTDVDQLPPDMQREVRRWTLPAGTRLLATARRPLTTLAAHQAFDADLAQRLSVIAIELTPLVERLVDLPLLTQALIEDINAVVDKQLAGMTPEALERLALHAWPGDVEELSRVLQTAHERAEGGHITVRDLPPEIDLARQAAAHRPSPAATASLAQTLAQTERALIERALTQARGNRTKAARTLGLSRPRLYRRMVQLGLEVEQPSDEATPDFEEQA